MAPPEKEAVSVRSAAPAAPATRHAPGTTEDCTQETPSSENSRVMAATSSDCACGRGRHQEHARLYQHAHR